MYHRIVFGIQVAQYLFRILSRRLGVETPEDRKRSAAQGSSVLDLAISLELGFGRML